MKEQLAQLNPHIPVIGCGDVGFARFGRRLDHYDWRPIRETVLSHALPEAGTSYVRTIPELAGLPSVAAMSQQIYGGQSLQVGLCLGHNDRMNAMEWHSDSEILGAATDLLLILGHTDDISEDTYRSDKAVAVWVEAMTLVELYATTLHFAPVHVDAAGFRAAIILPAMTNAPLDEPPPAEARTPFLFAQKKWLIAHPDSPPAGRGAHVGIVGDNVRIRIPG